MTGAAWTSAMSDERGVFVIRKLEENIEENIEENTEEKELSEGPVTSCNITMYERWRPQRDL
jgi:hypothetical protein